jgi:hypothetical protein
MSNCEFCHKVLSKEKGEEDHGCLDCHGYIYIINGVHVCFHCIEIDNKNLRDKVSKLERVIDGINNDFDEISEIEASEFNKLSSDYEELKIENKRLKREIEVLRQYGNKDCTAMADEVLDNE